jgi:hypothetical protein
MLNLNDGRNELWQWDTGRKLAVDADCSQVHFSNKVFGRSIDVDVADGVAIIPDVLLQTDKELIAWAFVGTPENGYTKISKVFKVNKRNKPADYVFTPPEQTTLGELIERLDKIEESQDPDAIKNAVDDYLANNPIEIDEIDPTVSEWAKQPTKPSYTASEVGALPADTVIPTIPDNVSAFHNDAGYLTEHQDLTGYATEQYVHGYAQPKGNYLTEVPAGYAKTEDIPTKPEDIGAQPKGEYLTAVPDGYATEEYVKNKIAEAELGGEEVDLSGYAKKSELPTKTSQLTNDSGFITKAPVESVNGKTGSVNLSASDVGARPDTWVPTAQEVGALPNTYVPPTQTAEQVGADPTGTAAKAVSEHNTDTAAHNDLRLELKAINDRLTAFFDCDDTTLDELSEIVASITSNKTLIDSITTSKVSVTDIINNLTTNVANKPLSAAQGVVLKGLIDAVSASLSGYQPKGDYALRSEVPTKVSQLQNDKGYLTEHQDISGKLDADKLPEAVNNALEQAKASGEFDGKDGKDGQDGYTPVKGVDYFDGDPGKDGVDGKDGADGYTPQKNVDYFDGRDGVDGQDGKDGQDGSPGKDGTSPVVTVSAITGGHRITITDASGTKTVDVLDGADGKDGTSVTVKSVSESTADGGSNVVTFSDGKTLTVKNGKQGSAGKTPVRGVDYYTEADKAEIVAMVIESLGGNPVFGYVDENNNIIVSGNLADGTYSVKYELENGSTVDIGNLVLDTNVYYSVTNNLTQCTNSNSATQAIGGQSYSATITAKSGYELKSVTVTMGGSPVTVNNGKINITNVTGNIVITAVAEEIKVNYTNLADPKSADWANGKRFNGSGALVDVDAGVNCATTNYIGGNLAVGDVIRVNGMDLTTYRTAVYDKNKSLQSLGALSGQTTYFSNITVNSTSASFTIKDSGSLVNGGFIRFCGPLNGTSADVIITKNEEIA